MNFNATFLVSAISFIIFVFIMNQIFYKPLGKIVEERNKIVEDNNDAAMKNNAIAEKLLSEREKKLQKINAECKIMIDAKTTEAKNNKENLIDNAKKASVTNVAENQKDLDNAFVETKENLKGNISGLANEITQKLFGEKVALKNYDDQAINEVMK